MFTGHCFRTSNNDDGFSFLNKLHLSPRSCVWLKWWRMLCFRVQGMLCCCSQALLCWRGWWGQETHLLSLGCHSASMEGEDSFWLHGLKSSEEGRESFLQNTFRLSSLPKNPFPFYWLSLDTLQTLSPARPGSCSPWQCCTNLHGSLGSAAIRELLPWGCHHGKQCSDGTFHSTTAQRQNLMKGILNIFCCCSANNKLRQ